MEGRRALILIFLLALGGAVYWFMRSAPERLKPKAPAPVATAPAPVPDTQPSPTGEAVAQPQVVAPPVPPPPPVPGGEQSPTPVSPGDLAKKIVPFDREGAVRALLEKPIAGLPETPAPNATAAAVPSPRATRVLSVEVKPEQPTQWQPPETPEYRAGQEQVQRANVHNETSVTRPTDRPTGRATNLQ